MRAIVHTYTHTHTHTYKVHTCIYTYIHTQDSVHVGNSTYIHTYRHTLIHTYTMNSYTRHRYDMNVCTKLQGLHSNLARTPHTHAPHTHTLTHTYMQDFLAKIRNLIPSATHTHTHVHSHSHTRTCRISWSNSAI
jgi:hypothetical protein